MSNTLSLQPEFPKEKERRGGEGANRNIGDQCSYLQCWKLEGNKKCFQAIEDMRVGVKPGILCSMKLLINRKGRIKI